MEKVKFYPDNYNKVNFFNLTDGTKVATYLSLQELSYELSTFQRDHDFKAQEFVEEINEQNEREIIKIMSSSS